MLEFWKKKLKGPTRNNKRTQRSKLVILYGGIVRGDWHEGSDLDLLAGSNDASPNFKDRGDKLISVIQGLPVEPHIYTTQEFEQMLNFNHRIGCLSQIFHHRLHPL